MRVFLQALGCRLNEAEMAAWSRDCLARGYRLAERAEQADLVVINTCAVTGESVRKSRQLVRRAHRSNPAARLVVSGCYASLEPDRLATDLGADLVVPNADKDRLIDIAAECLDLPVMPEAATEPGDYALLARARHRAFVKVQDGCRYRCAFCIVSSARGAERSRPIDAIVDEVDRLHAGGVHEVVLAGVHLGGYGSDRGTDLGALLRTLLERTHVPRVRLGSLEPWDLPNDLWSLFDNPRLMPHLHLPIQSGSDSVLRRLSRRCRTAEFARLVDQARATRPGFNITTDIIVGFPGETDREWRETLRFAEQMAFAHIHIFAYSPRAGTKAAGMPNQLGRDVKRQRSRELHELAARSRRQVLSATLGQTVEVLVEGPVDGAAGAQRWGGYSPGYLRVELVDAEDLENDIVRVRATGLSADGTRLFGRRL